MKASNLKPVLKSFYKDKEIALTFEMDKEQKFTAINAVVGTAEKRVEVKNFGILKAFKEIEKFFKEKLG